MDSINTRNIGFKANIADNKASSIANKPVEDKEKNNATKYALGATALAAVVIASIATKGRIKNGNPFKKAGVKFQNGFALGKDGKLFTGNVEHQAKNGSHFVFEYKDGYLIKSSKNMGKYQNLEDNFVKTYERNSGGKITKVERKMLKPDGSTTSRECIIKYDEDESVSFVNNFDGLAHAKIDGKVLCVNDPSHTRNTFHSNGKPYEQRFEDGSYTVSDECGHICEQKLKDGTLKKWSSEKRDNCFGFRVPTYRESGPQMSSITFKDGSSMKYDSITERYIQKNADGSRVEYDTKDIYDSYLNRCNPVKIEKYDGHNITPIHRGSMPWDDFKEKEIYKNFYEMWES